MNKVHCPHCKQQIEVSEVLAHELKEQLTAENSKKHAEDLEKVKRQAEEEVKGKLELELKILKEESFEKEKKLEEARNAEITLRREKLKLEDEKRELDLKIQRQIDEEREKIKINAQEEILEQQRLKDREKDLKIEGLMKALDEAQRKASQGSQQTQGEALELEFEMLLKHEFPNDKVNEVKKGTRGGDIQQEVWDRNGNMCGTILWEFKNTANWSETWVDKLKQDQRQISADTSVLVTEVLPKDIKTAGYRNGIWVTTKSHALVLALGLRANLIQVCQVKKSMDGMNGKKEIMWNYLSGTEFRHRMEAIVEAFTAMQDEIEKERRYFSLKWARDEKNIRRVIDNTHGLQGELESIMSGSMQTSNMISPPTSELEKQVN